MAFYVGFRLLKVAQHSRNAETFWEIIFEVSTTAMALCITGRLPGRVNHLNGFCNGCKSCSLRAAVPEFV